VFISFGFHCRNFQKPLKEKIGVNTAERDWGDRMPQRDITSDITGALTRYYGIGIFLKIHSKNYLILIRLYLPLR
ncbi:hypothetical protein, partial [Desulfitobacterium sp. LBE]|uniref:hypothetical protein n=1 Tax=Desulfitobacterium sp. LBE TaxID=884086 RepID=UPI001A9A7CCA